MTGFADIAFTPSVQRLQERHGSRAHYAARPGDGERAALGAREAEFLAQVDSFYLASVGETGWPYVQHRGGPRGFVRVLDPGRIAFADFRGNMQFVSAGNAAGNDRVALIMVDYFRRQRLKLLGRLRFVDAADADPALLARVDLPGYRARIDRIALIEVAAFDWNCPQHIPLRFSAGQVDAIVQPLRERIAELEARLHAADCSAASGV